MTKMIHLELVLSHKAKSGKGLWCRDQPSLAITKLFPILPSVKNTLDFSYRTHSRRFFLTKQSFQKFIKLKTVLQKIP